MYYRCTARFIQSRRLELDLSQEDVARAVGCSKVFISSLESGRAGVPSTKCGALAAVLKVRRGQIVDVMMRDYRRLYEEEVRCG